jgi:hypothetical protein
VHAPRGSRLEKSRQMPTAVSRGWIDQVAMLHGFVRNKDVAECARQRNMIYRHEISTAAESLGMMTPRQAEAKGWVSPEVLAQYYEYVGPTDEEYNTALTAFEAASQPKDPAAAVHAAQAADIATAAGVAKASEKAAKRLSKPKRARKKKVVTGRKSRKAAKVKVGK